MNELVLDNDADNSLTIVLTPLHTQQTEQNIPPFYCLGSILILSFRQHLKASQIPATSSASEDLGGERSSQRTSSLEDVLLSAVYTHLVHVGLFIYL